MFLKRTLMTALGALGLGALAAGPASAQQVPAPDLFDGQVACSNNVPAVPDTLATALTMHIMGGMVIAVGTDSGGDPDNSNITETGLTGLNYVIPPMLSNCGGGHWQNAGGEYLDADGEVLADQTDETLRVPTPISMDKGMAAMDVGAGYSATLDAFQAVVTADAALKAAQDALDELLEDETSDLLQTASIERATTARNEAETAQTTAHNALYAVAGPMVDGSIYRAGIAEWRAKGAVETAVGDWNTAIPAVTEAQTALNPSSYGNYVPLGNTSLIDAMVDDNDNVNLAAVRTYANANGSSSAVQDEGSGAITGGPGNVGDVPNFDSAGNLLVPGNDDDSDTDTPFIPAVNAMTFAEVNTRLESVGDTIEVLEKFVADNPDHLQAGPLRVAIARAKLEQAHYQAQFNAMIDDNTDLDTGEDGVQSLKTRYSAYTKATTTRDNAGVALTDALTARETATQNVVNAFTSPQSFYQQLVDYRNYLHVSAMAEETELKAKTGDDAATAAQVTAAERKTAGALTKLTEAQNTQMSFQDMLADDSPVKGLVEELLKGDTVGDDGGLLVSAIDGAYDAANNAVDALTAMDDPNTEEDETGVITKLQTDVSNLMTGGSGGVTEEELTMALSGLEGDGRTTETIKGNADAITGLDEDVGTINGILGIADPAHVPEGECTNAVCRNEGEIKHNADAITGLAGDGRTTETVKGNADAIAGLAGDGRTTETVMGNAQAIDNLAGEGRTTETVMGNANAIKSLAGEGHTTETVKGNADAIKTEADTRESEDARLAGEGHTTETIKGNADAIKTEADTRESEDARLAGEGHTTETIKGNADAAKAADGKAGAAMTAAMTADGKADGAQGAADGAMSAASAAQGRADNAFSMAQNNGMRIDGLQDQMDIVRAGVAASMALAGMPAVNGRGIAIGVGSFDGESAFAVGFQISGEQASFKVGVTSSGGETGVSAGVGFNF